MPSSYAATSSSSFFFFFFFSFFFPLMELCNFLFFTELCVSLSFFRLLLLFYSFWIPKSLMWLTLEMMKGFNFLIKAKKFQPLDLDLFFSCPIRVSIRVSMSGSRRVLVGIFSTKWLNPNLTHLIIVLWSFNPNPTY